MGWLSMRLLWIIVWAIAVLGPAGENVSHAATLHVARMGSNTAPYSTWETAANTVEAANDASVEGDTILFAADTITLQTINYLKRRITLRGLGRDRSVILGSPSVDYMFFAADSLVVEDLAFLGHIESSIESLPSYIAFIYLETSPRLHASFASCSFTNFGGKCLSFISNYNVQVRNCRFEDWTNGAAIYYPTNGDITVENCTFRLDDRHQPFLDFIFNRGKKIVRNNIFIGGGFYHTISGGHEIGTIEITNNLMYGNSSRNRQVISVSGEEITITNNSIVMSPPQDARHVDLIAAVVSTARRCWIMNNAITDLSSQLLLYGQAPQDCDFKIMYNCYYQNSASLRLPLVEINAVTPWPIDSLWTNLTVDPMFADPLNGDLRLQAGSPCVDAGAPWILDVDGSRSDIGAFGGPGGAVYAYQDHPPQMPQNVTLEHDANAVRLRWPANSESDLRHYAVFRATGATPPLDSAHLLAEISPGGAVEYAGGAKTLPAEVGTGQVRFSDAVKIGHVSYLRFTDRDIDSTADYTYSVVAVDRNNLVSPAAILGIQGVVMPRATQGIVPESYALEQNYPNPFNAVTAIVYRLPNLGAQPAPVSLTIFNSLGQRVQTLVYSAQFPGEQIAYWDGCDDSGQAVASGVYFYRLEVSGISFVESKKLVLLK